MQTQPSPIKSTPLPLPGSSIEAGLRLGLREAAGLPTLGAVFAQLPPQALVNHQLQRLRGRLPNAEGRALLAQAARPLHGGAVQLGWGLETAERQNLQAAASLLGVGLFLLESGGLPVSLDSCSLRHLHLHCVAAADPGRLPALAGEAADWAAETLRRWRRWSDRRFGPVQCLDWAPGRRHCTGLGYWFQGRAWRIRRLGERLRHQERCWRELSDSALHPLLQASATWRRLAGRSSAPAAGEATERDALGWC